MCMCVYVFMRVRESGYECRAVCWYANELLCVSMFVRELVRVFDGQFICASMLRVVMCVCEYG